MLKGRNKRTIFAGLLVIGLITLLFWRFHYFLRDLEEYCGIKTIYDRAESMYRLGYPPAVLAQTETAADGSGSWQTIYSTDRDADPKNAMPADKRIDDFNEWVYFDPKTGLSEATVHVVFDPKTNHVESISCVDLAEGSTRHTCPAFLGVEDGDTEEQLKDKLGKFNQQRYDGALKTVRYDALGVDFVLRRGRIYVLRTNREKGNVPIIFWRFVLTLLAPL
jgi:hypothetical protein